jgi:hypothetical protein
MSLSLLFFFLNVVLKALVRAVREEKGEGKKNPIQIEKEEARLSLFEDDVNLLCRKILRNPLKHFKYQ